MLYGTLDTDQGFRCPTQKRSKDESNRIQNDYRWNFPQTAADIVAFPNGAN